MPAGDRAAAARVGAGPQSAPQPEELVFAVTMVLASTKACAAHGDAAMFDVLSDYYALVARAVTPAGGRVIKVMGDGILLVFPPDRARQAVTVLRAVQADATARWQRFDERCRVQVKVGAGVLTCGLLGPPGQERYDIVGQALNALFKAPWGDFELTAEVTRLLE